MFVWPVLALAAVQNAAPLAEAVGKLDFAYPYPSPDGRSLAFQANVDGRWQLYAMNVADGSTRRLHVSQRDDTHPSWAPDGKRLAFISNRDGNDDVYILDIETGFARSVSPSPGKDGHPKWSPDGAWIIFNRTFDPADADGDLDSAIMAVKADGTRLSKLSDSPRVETFPSYSPDGASVVFIEWFPDANGQANRNGELIVVEIASGRRRNITNSEVFDSHPFWGASGEWIYFSRSLDGPKGRESVMHRIRPDGSAIVRLSDLDGRSEFRAIPSTDERTIYFNATVGGSTLIYKANLGPAGAD